MLKLGIVIYISVKHIRSHARSLGPHTWAKLTLFGIYISVKQIPSYVRSQVMSGLSDHILGQN